MYKGFIRFLQILFIILDLFLLNLSYLYAQSIYPESIQSHYYLRYQQFFIFMNAFWLLSTWIDAKYSTRHISFFDKFLKKTLRAYVLWAAFMLLFLYLPRRVELSSGLVYTCVTLFFIGLILNRFFYLGIKEWARKKVGLRRRVLIVGYNTLSKKLADYLKNDAFGIKIVGFIDDNPIRETPSLPVFKNIRETLKISNQLRVNEVYSTIMPEDNSHLYELMKKADQDLIRFRIVPDFSKLVNKSVHIDYLQDLTIFSVRKEPLENVINKFVKRAFDIVVSTLVAIFILTWLIPLIGLLIKLESPGPIFFVQIRSGLNNRPFRCFKFRSMGVNRESNSVQATKNDKRVTRTGRILRRTSLDEFPQFLNVFMGDMSLVGPRPHMLKHTKDYSNLDEEYMIRQFLKPGITGWAQVNGYRGEITELYHIKKRVEYDIWYLENWSLWLDIKIMFLTVYNVFKGEENAY